MKKINLPKSIMAVAGASAMLFSTGFVSGQPEVEKFKTIEVEETSVVYGRELYSCEGDYGNCLPTHEVTPEED